MARIYRRLRRPLGVVLAVAVLILLVWSVSDARPAALATRIVMLGVAALLQIAVALARTAPLVLDVCAHTTTVLAAALALDTVPPGVASIAVVGVLALAIGAATSALVAHVETTDRPPQDRL